MATLVEEYSLGGKPVNDGSCIYSWTYSLILVPPDHFLGTYEQGLEIASRIFGGKLDRFLKGLRPAYRWTGAANYRAYDDKKGVLPKVLHLWPTKCYVQLVPGRGAVLIKSPGCTVQRLDEVGFAPGVKMVSGYGKETSKRTR